MEIWHAMSEPEPKEIWTRSNSKRLLLCWGKKTCWLCVATAVVMLTVTIHQQCSLLFDFLFFQSCNQLEALVGPGSRNGPFGQGDSDTMSKMCYIKDQNDLHIIREYIHMIRKMSSTFHLKKHKDWDKVRWRRSLKPHWKKCLDEKKPLKVCEDRDSAGQEGPRDLKTNSRTLNLILEHTGSQSRSTVSCEAALVFISMFGFSSCWNAVCGETRNYGITTTSVRLCWVQQSALMTWCLSHKTLQNSAALCTSAKCC